MTALLLAGFLAVLVPQDPPVSEPAVAPSTAPATESEDDAKDALEEQRTWKVGDVERMALVHVPPKAKDAPVPLVFVFHGHGGSMRNAARTFRIHEHWPEALVVYPQGLNTPGQITDPEGKRTGWQKEVGDQGDRDLAFFDAVLADLKQQYRVDPRRVHATGHSNGGGFTYLLWAARGDVFASFAPSGAAFNKSLRGATLVPRPVFHLSGRTDPLVKYAWQALTVAELVKRGECSAPEAWKAHEGCTIQRSSKGADVVTLVHEGGHRFLPTWGALIVEFFRDTPRPEPVEPVKKVEPATTGK